MHDASAPRRFNTTHWSLVLATRDTETNASRARKALGALCQAYWFPLYAFVRQGGYSAADSQDLTQAFFAAFLEKGGFAAANPDRGRFRSYLLGCLKHFLSHERERQGAKKRGGDVQFVELDALEPEARYALEPMHTDDPEACYHSVWAQEVNARALRTLKHESKRLGKMAQYECLRGCLTGEDVDRGLAAAELGLSEGAIKVAVHRLRKHYREVLRAEVADTVSHPEEIDDEMRCLIAALVRR